MERYHGSCLNEAEDEDGYAPGSGSGSVGETELRAGAELSLRGEARSCCGCTPYVYELKVSFSTQLF